MNEALTIKDVSCPTCDVPFNVEVDAASLMHASISQTPIKSECPHCWAYMEWDLEAGDHGGYKLGRLVTHIEGHEDDY